MKYVLMGIAFFQIAFVFLTVGIALELQDRLGLFQVLMVTGLLAIINGVLPILRSRKLDTLNKRKLALLIFIGFSIQLIAMIIAERNPERFISYVGLRHISDLKLFWFGELVGLVGIASSFWHHITVMPFKKWLSMGPT
jgi:di/tricarboxylate transporter